MFLFKLFLLMNLRIFNKWYILLKILNILFERVNVNLKLLLYRNMQSYICLVLLKLLLIFFKMLSGIHRTKLIELVLLIFNFKRILWPIEYVVVHKHHGILMVSISANWLITFTILNCFSRLRYNLGCLSAQCLPR